MIDILMTTYNGEKYVKQQIESIINQTNSNWMLFIQDDCSTDGTLNVLKPYVKRYPERIFVYKNDKNSGSACKNFFNMLKYVKHKYIVFCDQDDVWHPQKLEDTYRKMLEVESNNVDKPVLVHSDLKVVDKNLEILSNSLFKLQKLDYKADRLNNLLAQNIVTGCTAMVNNELVSMIKDIPVNVIMHDWWFALIACCFGKIGFVNKPLVMYRQHNDNEVGAKNVSSLKYLFSKMIGYKNAKKTLIDTYKQAESFLNLYKDRLNKKQIEIISAYSSLLKVSKMKRIYILFKYNFFKKGLFRKLGQLIYI